MFYKYYVFVNNIIFISIFPSDSYILKKYYIFLKKECEISKLHFKNYMCLIIKVYGYQFGIVISIEINMQLFFAKYRIKRLTLVDH